MRITHYLLIGMGTLLGFGFHSAQAQQAWTKPKGGFYTQIGGSFLQANQVLNGLEKPVALNRQVTDVTFQFYGEYGLTNWLTASAQVPFKVLQVTNETANLPQQEGSLNALSNIQAALTARIYQKNGWMVSGKAGVALPTARYQANTGLRSGFDALTVAPSLMAGYGHPKFFTSAEVGIALRNNGYSNRYFAAWQIGKFVGKNKRLLPILAFEFVKSAENGTYNDGTSSSTGLYLDAQSYLSPGLKLGYKASKSVMLWASVGGGVGGVTRNIAASPGLSFSISYQN